MDRLVSVVMPVRNGGAHLAGAVASILTQTYADIELLLIDDHSNDGAIASLDDVDHRLKIVRNAGSGLVAALNFGIERANGQYIARMDADDIAMPARLETQISYLDAHPEIDICGACVEIFSSEGIRAGNLRYQRWLNSVRTPEEIHRRIFVESPMPHPSAVFRSRAIKALGGYRDRGWPEDYDLFLRADAAGMKMGKPPQVLLRWRDHEQRLTRTDPVYDLPRFQAAKAHFLVQHRLNGRGVIIWGAGKTGRQMHDVLRDEGAHIIGFIDVHPRRIGGRKRGLPVWPMQYAQTIKDNWILVAVGAAGAREEIGEWLERRNKHEGIDYLFVA